MVCSTQVPLPRFSHPLLPQQQQQRGVVLSPFPVFNRTWEPTNEGRSKERGWLCCVLWQFSTTILRQADHVFSNKINRWSRAILCVIPPLSRRRTSTEWRGRMGTVDKKMALGQSDVAGYSHEFKPQAPIYRRHARGLPYHPQGTRRFSRCPTAGSVFLPLPLEPAPNSGDG